MKMIPKKPKYMNRRKIASIGTGIGMAAIVIFVATPAFAETNTYAQGPRTGMMGIMRPRQNMKPAIIGSVSAISGTTITLTGRQTPGNNASTTFSIDASSATVFKNNATSTVSGIAVGDMIFVQGTVSGTNVTATVIRDGVRGVGFGPGREDKERTASTTVPFTGNGQPLVAGKISSFSGNTLNITTGNNIVYTVDATNAKIMKGKDTIALSNVVVGEGVLVQGTVNGTSIVASTIIEQPQHPVVTNNSANGQSHGFFGNISGFFMHLFGF